MTNPTAPPVERRWYPVPIPQRMRGLPTDPRTRHLVPWFIVPSKLEDGSYEFRGVEYSRLQEALLYNKCWLCGEWMGGGDKWFVIGPMCCINRVSSEPPSHHECAQFAVQTCPFMMMPKAVRRGEDMSQQFDENRGLGGIMIKRNPGVMLLWHTRRFHQRPDQRDTIVLDIGEPLGMEWWTQGRRATRAEVLASIESGIPALRAIADSERYPADQRAAHTLLDFKYTHVTQHYLPPSEGDNQH